MFVCCNSINLCFFFFFQAEDGIRDLIVTGVQTCALPISGLRYSTLARIVAATPSVTELSLTRGVFPTRSAMCSAYFTLAILSDAGHRPGPPRTSIDPSGDPSAGPGDRRAPLQQTVEAAPVSRLDTGCEGMGA